MKLTDCKNLLKTIRDTPSIDEGEYLNSFLRTCIYLEIFLNGECFSSSEEIKSVFEKFKESLYNLKDFVYDFNSFKHNVELLEANILGLGDENPYLKKIYLDNGTVEEFYHIVQDRVSDKQVIYKHRDTGHVYSINSYKILNSPNPHPRIPSGVKVLKIEHIK